MDSGNGSESEDEILLSPRTMKRDGEGDGGGREYKRRRRDAKLAPLPHIPIVVVKGDVGDENLVLSAPPVTTTLGTGRSRSTSGKKATGGKGDEYTRARSVPSFPSTPSEPPSHLDLYTTIPASPPRHRVESLPAPVSPHKEKEPDVIMASPPRPSTLDSLTSQTLPTTPINSLPHLAFSFDSPMSPLTPLPPTPMPPGPFKFGAGIVGDMSKEAQQRKRLGKAKGKGSGLRETLFLVSTYFILLFLFSICLFVKISLG
jgi:hypothetical protein